MSFKMCRLRSNYPQISKGDDPWQVATSAQKIKEEGNKHFAKKEYQKALDAYDRALKACEGTSAEVPLLHSNKAACFMMQAR